MIGKFIPKRIKKTLPYQALCTVYSEMIDHSNLKKFQKQYADNSFEKTLDIDWAAINYNRVAVVNFLVSQFENCDYLEIGCCNNVLFDAVIAQNKVGVDPYTGGTIKKTSDAFFEENTSLFDVVFIDGLHEYTQVHRDVANSIKFLNPGGWIALHDMIPRSWLEQHVPNIIGGPWTGDVWKVAFELANTAGIEFKILKVDHGVGVFRLTEQKPKLVDLSDQLLNKQFEYFYENMPKLPILEFNDALSWIKNNKLIN